MLKLLEKRSLPLGSRVLSRTGFAIGSACGREMAEIYMHILEGDLLLANMLHVLHAQYPLQQALRG
jgi:hypothetical protein